MEETSLGKQFSGLNCINYDMFKEVAVDFRAQTEKKMGRDVKRLKLAPTNQNHSFLFKPQSSAHKRIIFLAFHS